MNKFILLWAIATTLLSVFFIWRYEAKECEQVTINNIVDTAVIYIPFGKDVIGDLTGEPGLKLPKFPSIIQSGKQKRFVIMPQVTLGNEKFGTSIGISAMYLRDRWTYSYTYDFMLKSHSVGIGIRF